MSYDELKAAELRALCEQRGLKVHRAKADMIKELKEFDAAQEIKEYYGDEPAPLPDGVLPDSEEDPAPEVQPEPEKPAERPVEVLNLAEGDGWVEDGIFLKAFPRAYSLDVYEHESNLRRVVEYAFMAGLEPYGPPYRKADKTTATTWVYAVNVRE